MCIVTVKSLLVSKVSSQFSIISVFVQQAFSFTSTTIEPKLHLLDQVSVHSLLSHMQKLTVSVRLHWTADSEMFSGGCLFVDHASGYIHVKFQTSLNTHETINAKDNFELMCRDHGVVPQSYLTDNGSAFTLAGFTAKL